jgi:hypothetical protein
VSSGREDASEVLSFKLTVSGHYSIQRRVSGAVGATSSLDMMLTSELLLPLFICLILQMKSDNYGTKSMQIVRTLKYRTL